MRKVVLTVAFLLISTSGFAQKDWVSRFIESYRPLPGLASVGVGTPALGAAAEQSDAIALTTNDLVRMLLANNRDVTVDRAVPLSSLYAVESFLRPFQPNFHVIGNVNKATTPSSSVLAGAASLIQLTHDYKVGLDQALPTGTSYTVDFNYLRNSTNSVFYVYNPSYNGLIRYAITQRILRGFGRDANSNEIRIARNNEKISELDFELQLIDSITEALASYWDLVFASQDMRVKQRSLDLASKTLHDNQIQVQVGSLAPIDLVQAEAEVATRNDELITVRYTIDQLQDQMKKLISSEPDPGLALARLDLIEPLRQPDGETLPSLPDAVRYALENRKEMKQAVYDIENHEINRLYAKNQMRPVLDITASYAHSGLGGTQTIRSSVQQGSEIIEVIPGGVGGVFKQLYSFKYPAYSAGFTLEIPLSNNAAKAEYARAANERELAAMRKAATAQKIVIEVRNAYSQVEMNRAKVVTARKAHELSKRRLEAEERKYALGTSTVRFVLEEQRNVAQSETNEIQALVNYNKSLVTFDRAIGDTFAKNQIQTATQLNQASPN